MDTDLIQVKKAGASDFISLPNPKTYSVAISDVDYESGRNQRGYMFRDRVAVKRKVSCTWAGLSSSEIATILNAIEDASFTLKYKEPTTGEYRPMTAYVGDREATVYTAVGGTLIYEALSADFVEF